jgi:uncharacterized protein YndB with AHSA1/START domain
MSTDSIRKEVLLKAPLERVWRAVADAKEFGRWFGVALDGPFVAGKPLTGRIVPTTADPEVAKMQKPYEGMKFDIVVEAVEPMRRFAFRWHPFAIEPGVDYSKEPMTTIVFALEEVAGGTRLTITESGFDAIPVARRAKAFAANEGGWEKQAELVAKYLAMHAK